MTEEQSANLRLIAQAAVASERATGCPAELQAVQCILETGWLKHAPGNNCFGVKAYAGAFGRQLLATREWFTGAELKQFLATRGRTAALVQPVQQGAKGRRLFSVEDWFATFATLADCFAWRAAMFTAGRYAPFAAAYRRNPDLKALVRGFASVYATDPAYADNLLSLLERTDVKAALAKARAGAAV